jgi:dGTPase
MNWETLLSLNRAGDEVIRRRNEQDETRLGFEVDYDRIIFSSAFRSLQDKTQVVPLPIQASSRKGFVHTRLTHSLEVSVVGRSIGRLAGKIILERQPELIKKGYRFNDFGAIVAAASLAHDIGNPPFGHSGEKAIGNFFSNGQGAQYASELSANEYQDLIKFEGNANGFRLLTESREGVPGGLRLSYGTLGAYVKYPKRALPHRPTSHVADKKYGVFDANWSDFCALANKLGLSDQSGGYYRHPLVYLVEAADDLCYTLIDFEDAINMGYISEDYALENLINLVKHQIDGAKYRSLVTTSDRISYLRALAIGTLVSEAVSIFADNQSLILAGGLEKSLIDYSAHSAAIKDIISLSVKHLYQAEEVVEKEIAGYQILSKLVEVCSKALISESKAEAGVYDQLILSKIPHQFRSSYDQGTYTCLLNASSFVASLSDSQAIGLHQTIQGIF